MPIHLVKLCVGCESIADLGEWIAERRAAAAARGETYEQFHTTRAVPKRAAELLEGGSLYWVIRGAIQVRQSLLDIRPFIDKDNISRCHLVLDQTLVATALRPMRPFQGWRYLKPEVAPPDTGAGIGADGLPDALRLELARLGLL